MVESSRRSYVVRRTFVSLTAFVQILELKRVTTV